MKHKRKGKTMNANEARLWWNGRELVRVTLVNEVTGGWLVRLENGMLVGPVAVQEPSVGVTTILR
jgi:hypothetical protein